MHPVIRIFCIFIYLKKSTVSKTLQKPQVQEKSGPGSIVGARPLFVRLGQFFGIFGVFWNYISSDAVVWTT